MESCGPVTIRATTPLDAVIAGLLLMARMRRSEVSALRWSDVVDVTDVSLTIYREISCRASLSFAPHEHVYNGAEPENLVQRTTDYESLTNKHYDLVTDFYEWGWGESFHFAPPGPERELFRVTRSP